jgi:hypothetical protein
VRKSSGGPGRIPPKFPDQNTSRRACLDGSYAVATAGFEAGTALYFL